MLTPYGYNLLRKVVKIVDKRSNKIGVYSLFKLSYNTSNL